MNIIHLHKLTKTYEVGSEKVHALKSIDLSIEQGEYVSIMGQSGSGKSTMLNILGCLDTPTSGSYILNNNDVMTLQNDELTEIRNREIGFVFQSFNLLPRYNALDNVCLPLIYSGISKTDRQRKAKEALCMVGLENRMLHKPMEMSGGQRQRVAIARALVNSPAMILADEPTGNLDSTTSHEIMHLFSELNRQGNTIVVVTHENDIAAYTKRTVVLHDGQIDTDRILKTE